MPRVDDCKVSPVPGCPGQPAPAPIGVSGPTKEVTGEVCVNAEYDALSAGSSTKCGSVGGGRDCWDVPTPMRYQHKEQNVCVDVYNGDLADATSRLDSLLLDKKAKGGWKNDEYYCISGMTRFLMSIFQSDSLNYSDRYCGKIKESAKAAEPAVKEEGGFSLWDAFNRSFEMQRETREMFREQCDAGSWAGCFNLGNYGFKANY